MVVLEMSMVTMIMLVILILTTKVLLMLVVTFSGVNILMMMIVTRILMIQVLSWSIVQANYAL